MVKTYTTLENETVRFDDATEDEEKFIRVALEYYDLNPNWFDFSRWRARQVLKLYGPKLCDVLAGFRKELHKVHQDLERRLMNAQPGNKPT